MILSEKAETLLRSAAESKEGQMLYVRGLGTEFIRAGNTDFNLLDPTSARDAAFWKQAFRDLVAGEYIETTDHNKIGYLVTAKGYNYLDDVK